MFLSKETLVFRVFLQNRKFKGVATLCIHESSNFFWTFRGNLFSRMREFVTLPREFILADKNILIQLLTL